MACKKRPPAWPSRDEEQSSAGKALESAKGVQEYRKKLRSIDKKMQPPQLNTWVTVLPNTSAKGYIKVADRATAETPALVSAATIEDGEGSAAVIYPNPLVLLHGFGGAPLIRKLVPFDRLRPCNASQAELQALEQKLGEAVYAEAKKKLSINITVSGGDVDYGKLEGAAIKCNFGKQLVEEEEPLAPTTPEPTRKFRSPSPAALTSATKEATSKGAASFSPKQFSNFTKAVSKALRKNAECRRALDELLEEIAIEFSEFDEAMFRAGLTKLEALNKVLLVDGLVFGTF